MLEFREGSRVVQGICQVDEREEYWWWLLGIVEL